MAERKAYHAFRSYLYGETGERKLMMIETWSVASAAIGPEQTGDSREFCFWRLEYSTHPPIYDRTTVELTVSGCISKVVLSATEPNVTYEIRMSLWEEALVDVKTTLLSFFGNDCQQDTDPKKYSQPWLTTGQTNELKAVFFKLTYTREEVIGERVPNALDENIDICDISEALSGFRLNLRTSKNKAAKKISEKIKAEMTESSAARPSSLGSPVKLVTSASASGIPVLVASASASGSPVDLVAIAFASGSPVEPYAGTPAKGSPARVVAGASASESPMKRVASLSVLSPGKGFPSRSRSRSPFKRVAGLSRPRSPSELGSKENEQDFFYYGLITVLQEENEINVSLYSLDMDLMKFLMGRFGLERLKELKYVTKEEAQIHCKDKKIKDPFEDSTSTSALGTCL